MKISHYMEHSIACISVNTAIAASEVQEIKNYILEVLNDSSVRGLVLNLKEVQFIDSRGLGLFPWLINHLKPLKLPLALCEVSSRVLPLMRMTQVDKLIKIYPSESEAFRLLMT